MPAATDTICAIATPPGRGGVGMIRVSGPDVPALARAVLGRLPEPRRAVYGRFLAQDGVAIDAGLAIYFPAPGSFTGEAVLELHGHGSPIALDRLLQCLLAGGARLARPGEFSERAFLNGRLDLAQAEAVADLIEARTEAGARAAMRSLAGEFSRAVETLVDAVTELRVYVESAIDFPDEEVDFLTDGEVSRRLDAVETRLEATLAGARRGRLLSEGLSVVLAGRPNVGKSSLLNRLSGAEAAIVTEVPGTTRDTLREQIQIDGMPLSVVDTAGLRESPDRIEQEGIRRAWNAIAQCDRLLLVVDDRIGIGAPERDVAARLSAGTAVTVIRNKVDLTGAAPGLDDGELGPEVRLCAVDGRGMEVLRRHLRQAAGLDQGVDGFSARRRHLDALERAQQHLRYAREQLERYAAGELMAEELRLVQTALGEITGVVTSEDLLGRIFASFCIGK